MSEIYIEAPSDPNTVIKIGYKTGDTSPYADFYQSMGEDVPPAKDMSDWLLRLDHLIESWDIPAIKLLAEANGLKFLPLDLDAEEVIQAVKDRPQDFEPILEKYR